MRDLGEGNRRRRSVDSRDSSRRQRQGWRASAATTGERKAIVVISRVPRVGIWAVDTSRGRVGDTIGRFVFSQNSL